MERPLTALQAGLASVGCYAWSPDNSQELANVWIHTAVTFEELASLVGIDDTEAAARRRERADPGRPREAER
jgi:hypothetical protein